MTVLSEVRPPVPKAVRAALLERDAKTCQRCGRVGEIGWYSDMLCIHHRDRDPQNNALDNLELLCRGCHSRMHHEQGDIPRSAGRLVGVYGIESAEMPAQELRDLLNAAERGQEWLARQLGYSKASVSAWACGRQAIPVEQHVVIRRLLEPSTCPACGERVPAMSEAT